MTEARKTVTVVFSEVVGSTGLGEQLDPEVSRGLMARYFDEMRSVIERHGGVVEEFIGDAVMAVFGIPILHEDDALRAVRAAAEMRERLAVLNESFWLEHGARLGVRVGVDTGEVVTGDTSEGQFYVTGDAVNVAARLEQAADPGDILLGEATYSLVRDAVRVEPSEPLILKGKTKPVPAVRLLEVLSAAPGFIRHLDAPFVGREPELAALASALDESARTGTCRLITIVGVPGIGKSRLVREFLARTAERVRVVVGRCLSYGEGITYWPLAEIVKQVAGEEVRPRLAELVGGDDAESVADRVTGAVGLSGTASRTEEIFWAVRRLFEALAREQPLVVVLDDVHWAEPTMLDLIEYLLAFAHAPLLVVCAARPDLFDARPSRALPSPGASLMSLESLSDAESQALVAGLGGNEATTHVVETAEGNPLFLEQLLAFNKDRRTSDAITTPPTIQALIGARIDRLTNAERAVLERASVEGRTFHLGAVSELLPDDVRPESGASVLSLVRRSLVRPDDSLFSGDAGFRFVHILVRDVAYEAMPKAVRAESHERYAHWLEHTAGARSAEYDDIIAYHLEQAAAYNRQLRPGDNRTGELMARAAKSLAAAGRRALTRGDVHGSANLLERALKPLTVHDARWLDIMADLYDSYFQAGRLTDAEALLDDVAMPSADGRAEATIELLRAGLQLATDPDVRFEKVLDAGRRAIPVFEDCEDDRGLSRALDIIVDVHWYRGALDQMREAAEQALIYAERTGDVRAQGAHRKTILAAVVFGASPLTESEPLLDRELEWARTTGARYHEAMCLIALGRHQAARGHIDEGRRLIDQGTDLFDDLGMRLEAPGRIGIWINLVHEDPTLVERELRNAYSKLAAAGEKGVRSTIAALLGEAVLAQGRTDEAVRFLDEAEDIGASDDVTTQVILARVRAKVLAQAGKPEEAQRTARQAVTRASGTEDIQLHADTLAVLGEVLAATARPQEAVEALTGAIAMYDEKGLLVLANRARTRLTELQRVDSASQ